MPDQSDVEFALASLAASAIYPNGPTAPSATGSLTRIYRGWPNAAALDADLAAGRINVTVFPITGSIRDTTRYTPDWQATSATPTLMASILGDTISFTGSADPGQLAGLRVGAKTYVRRIGPNETLALVAAILAVAVAADRPALAAGTSITIPGATDLLARTAIDTAATSDLRRQIQTFRITAWCPTPTSRDVAAATVDATFAATPFLTVTAAAAPTDSAACRLRYVSTTTFDQSQDAALYRRDLLYSVEFPTLASALQPSMLFGIARFVEGATDTTLTS